VDLCTGKASKVSGLNRDRGLSSCNCRVTVPAAEQSDVSYCTNAAAAAKMVAGITWVSFPEALDVPGLYAIGAAKDAGREADDFITFLTGGESKQILFNYGFR
jgi:ABC-type molybdate transport system substrate-binding protein